MEFKICCKRVFILFLGSCFFLSLTIMLYVIYKKKLTQLKFCLECILKTFLAFKEAPLSLVFN